MHRLAGVGDEVAPVAYVAPGQRLAQLELVAEPGAVRARRRGPQPNSQRPPDAEVLPHLLEAVDQRVGQVAGRVLGLATRAGGGALRGVVGLARRRERVQPYDAALDEALVVDVDVVAGVALGIVDRAGGADPAVGADDR